jgi:hypothetical protein
MLLVVLLALLTPLWRLILAVFLFFVTLFLRLMNSPAIMLRRAVNSHELQRLCLRRVDELVLSAGWDDDDVGSFDVLQQASITDDMLYLDRSYRSYLIFARDSRSALSTCEDKHLIHSVNFISNVASNRNLHRN